ncbi:MAG: hypothetical protein H6621_11725 [Halobacteriovoraceae bacterium]|nr:hypothetical protein [Halobacteriovoraceae bacterium]MCB9095729.1 hypothetical protein [Halobacteriovoraceae bacterium]
MLKMIFLTSALSLLTPISFAIESTSISSLNYLPEKNKTTFETTVQKVNRKINSGYSQSYTKYSENPAVVRLKATYTLKDQQYAGLAIGYNSADYDEFASNSKSGYLESPELIWGGRFLNIDEHNINVELALSPKLEKTNPIYTLENRPLSGANRVRFEVNYSKDGERFQPGAFARIEYWGELEQENSTDRFKSESRTDFTLGAETRIFSNERNMYLGLLASINFLDDNNTTYLSLLDENRIQSNFDPSLRTYLSFGYLFNDNNSLELGWNREIINSNTKYDSAHSSLPDNFSEKQTTDSLVLSYKTIL